MIIRPYEAEDLAAVEEIHKAQRLGYDFPELEHPSYFIRLVGEKDGQIVEAAFAHLTAEIHFMVRTDVATAQERHFWFLEVQEVVCQLSWNPGGLIDLHAFLPPQLERAFAKRLMAHGWKRPLWPCYVLNL